MSLLQQLVRTYSSQFGRSDVSTLVCLGSMIYCVTSYSESVSNLNSRVNNLLQPLIDLFVNLVTCWTRLNIKFQKTNTQVTSNQVAYFMPRNSWVHPYSELLNSPTNRILVFYFQYILKKVNKILSNYIKGEISYIHFVKYHFSYIHLE